LLRSVSDAQDADIIVYSGQINDEGFRLLFQQIREFREKRNVLTFLTTYGGFPDSAYRIARCLQRAYSDGRFILFVDSHCKSSGTLIAIGADEIVMSTIAELGPLDVQLSKPDALGEQTSGLTPTEAIGTLRDRAFESMESCFLSLRFKSGLRITTRTALEVAATLTTGLFRPIFAQIDPMRIGEIARAMLVAKEYGKRLSKKRGELAEALDRLVSDYPSHDFVIDRDEANELFGNVREPTEEEESLARIVDEISKGSETNEPFVVFLSSMIERDEPVQQAEKGENDESNRCVDGNEDAHRQSGVPEGSGGDDDSHPGKGGTAATKGGGKKRKAPRK
jgi:hypothetical protein